MIKNIMYMIAAFGAVALAGCEAVYTEGDELFYQISEADSTRCMEEILEEIRITAKENQDLEDNYWKSQVVCFPDCIHLRPNLKISIGKSGRVFAPILEWPNEITDTTDLIAELVDYFMMNRNLTEAETANEALNSNSRGFNYPFYNQFTLEEIEQSIEMTTKEYQEITALPDVDSNLIDFYRSKVDEWEDKRNTLFFIKAKSLPEMSPYIRLTIEYPHPSIKSNEILDKAALVFYHLRNIECLRYFGETYLSLYDRFQRKKQPLDKEKLEALEIVRPIVIYDKNLEVSPRSYWPVEEPPLAR